MNAQAYGLDPLGISLGCQSYFHNQGFPQKTLLTLETRLAHLDASQLISGTTDGFIQSMCQSAK